MLSTSESDVRPMRVVLRSSACLVILGMVQAAFDVASPSTTPLSIDLEKSSGFSSVRLLSSAHQVWHLALNTEAMTIGLAKQVWTGGKPNRTRDNLSHASSANRDYDRCCEPAPGGCLSPIDRINCPVPFYFCIEGKLCCR